MKNSDSNSKNTMDEEVECEVRPGGMLVQRRLDEHDQDPHDDGPDGVIGGSLIKLSVTQSRFKARDYTHHELSVPESYTFGDVKKVLAEITGIDPVEQKLLFRGEEKEDSEKLQEVGVRDKAKLVLLMEPTIKEKKAEETKPDVNNDIPEENNEKKEEDAEMLKSFKAVDVVRQEVDKIAERVSALEVAVNCGNKLTNEEFIVPSELLMRQLLKLDTIEAEGEARLQRKAEVVRVQKFHDILDELKTKNSKPNDVNNSSSTTTTTSTVTTKWETFDSGVGSLNHPPPPPISSSSLPTITEDWEQFD